MIAIIFEWIVVGAANRLVVATPELIEQGGVTADEAFKLLATEWGRHVRYFAQEIVHAFAADDRQSCAPGSDSPIPRQGTHS